MKLVPLSHFEECLFALGIFLLLATAAMRRGGVK